MKKLSLLTLMSTLFALSSCLKDNSQSAKEAHRAKVIATIQPIVQQYSFLTLETDSLQNGIHFEFDDVDKLEKFAREMEGKTEDKIFIDYNPEMTTGVGPEVCPAEAFEEIHMIERESMERDEYVTDARDVAFEVKTMNPMVSYFIEFKTGGSGQYCVAQPANGLVPVYFSFSHKASLMGVNPLNCLQVFGCQGYDTWDCDRSKLEVKLSWFFRLATPLGNITRRMEMVCRIWYV